MEGCEAMSCCSCSVPRAHTQLQGQQSSRTRLGEWVQLTGAWAALREKAAPHPPQALGAPGEGGQAVGGSTSQLTPSSPRLAAALPPLCCPCRLAPGPVRGSLVH